MCRRTCPTHQLVLVLPGSKHKHLLRGSVPREAFQEASRPTGQGASTVRLSHYAASSVPRGKQPGRMKTTRQCLMRPAVLQARDCTVQLASTLGSSVDALLRTAHCSELEHLDCTARSVHWEVISRRAQGAGAVARRKVPLIYRKLTVNQRSSTVEDAEARRRFLVRHVNSLLWS